MFKRTIVSLLVVFTASVTAAQIPGQINFQGLLLDSVGDPVNGQVDMIFTLFDAETAGSSLWTETQNGIEVLDGVYQAGLGSTTPITSAILSGGSVFLEVEVEGETLSPRQRLLAVPYAINAESAETTSSVNGLSSVYFTELLEHVSFDGGDPPNLDPKEGFIDVDGDGIANFVDSDNDGDGQSDTVELGQGSDINLVTPIVSGTNPVTADGFVTSTVEIQGQLFDPGLTVAFGSESPTATSITSSSFDVQVGSQPEGTVNVVVTNPNGESDAITFDFFYFDPVISSLNPGVGSTTAPTNVTVTGENFVAGLTVGFGAENPTPTNITPTSFEVTVGPPAIPGEVDVTVTLPTGKSTTVPFLFSNPRRVFATEQLYKGDHGGLTGADARCNAEAALAGRTEVFKAWLGDASVGPDTRFAQDAGPYYRYDDVKVADNWLDLTDGMLDAPIDRTASAAVIESNTGVWTNVQTSGQTEAGADCTGWTVDNTGFGRRGLATSTDSTWTGGGTIFCAGNARLYCFED